MTIGEISQEFKEAMTYIVWARQNYDRFQPGELVNYACGMIQLAEVIKPIYENHNGGRDDEGTVGA